MMRRFILVSLVAAFAFGLVSQFGGETEPAFAASDMRSAARGPDQISGKPLYRKARVQRYARSVGATRYIKRTIPIYYRLARKRNIAPDVLVAQAMVETGNGGYGGDSRPWNMAGI
ncbi:MAG: glucosaminidase domain-containing protein, partial [Rubrobacteraceae bacterium]